MLEEMTSGQLAEWMAFSDIEPFGTVPADLRAGIVAATVANTAFGAKKRSFTPKDFMPAYDAPPARPPTLAEKLIERFKKLGAVEVK